MNKSKFPLISFLFLIACIFTVGFTGCGTVPDGVELTLAQKESKAHKFAAILETATSGSTYMVVSNNPDHRDSVITAATAIRAITQSGAIDRAAIIAAISQSSDDGPAIALGLGSALNLYEAFLSDNAHLPDAAILPYASIVLNGIARGAEVGARLTAPPPTASPSIPPGYFRL